MKKSIKISMKDAKKIFSNASELMLKKFVKHYNKRIKRKMKKLKKIKKLKI